MTICENYIQLYLWNNSISCQFHFIKAMLISFCLNPSYFNDLFTEKMLEEGIVVRITNAFGLKNWIRVTVGTHEADVAFINAYKNMLNKFKN